MPADIPAQKLVLHVGLRGAGEHVLDGSADITCGVNQCAVNIEKVDGETWDRFQDAGGFSRQAGCGRSPPSSPGTPLPPSGRITCWGFSDPSLGPLDFVLWNVGNSPPSISTLTSDPSSTSRSS